VRVFISWSGERSNQLALALYEWLPLVLHYVKPWLSKTDIQAGDRWTQSVAQELTTSNFGIVCVTPENANAPWLLFESGALAKSLEIGKVIPLLYELEFAEFSGPLTQFQAKKLTQEGLHEIVQSLQSSAEEPVPEARARHLFEALWPELEKKLVDLLKYLRRLRKNDMSVLKLKSWRNWLRVFGHLTHEFNNLINLSREFLLNGMLGTVIYCDPTLFNMRPTALLAHQVTQSCF